MHEVIQAIILGLVQGLTEFIPVSSSAHLIIAEYYTGANFTSLAYDVVLHLATLISLLVYFRSDIVRAIKKLKDPQRDSKLLVALTVATIPAVIAGYFFQDIIETSLRSLWVIVVMLVAVALLMFIADRQEGTRTVKDISYKDAFIIGCAQALALIPGTSRAGSTIVAGSLLGFNNAESARFSFYMAIPILFGANVRVLATPQVRSEVMAELPLFIIGSIVALVVAYFVIRFLLNYLSTHKLAVFAWYRIGLAAILTITLVM